LGSVKRVSSPKNENLLTLKLFQTCMSFFLLLNTKEVLLKKMGNQTVARQKKKGSIKCLFTYILQKFFFCVQLKKETHTGLEQLEGEEMMTEFKFLGELSFNIIVQK